MTFASKLNDMFGLDGKTALVTGASSGIGEHAARLFGLAGCNVVLTARRLDKVRSIASEIESDGASSVGVEMDVNDRSSVERAVAAAIERFESIDILLNNAGIARTERFLEMSEQQWKEVIDTNLSGVWRVGQIASGYMVQQPKGGCIINIASVLGMAVQRRQANYSCAKSAVIQLTRTMALELGIKGVRVNAIAPGYFMTDINQEFLTSEVGRKYIGSLFPGRAGTLDELDGVLLLLAAQAGSYIQGSVITVDGGTLLAGV
jgi:NAD(P)-dependent dehydrogenase (short-subunit alcohol dehydrogenase family)